MEDHTPHDPPPSPDADTAAPPSSPAAARSSIPPAVPRCTSCGYELTGMRVDGKCPECGAPVWGSNRIPPTSGYAVTSLVLGILAGASVLLFCVFWPFAFIFGVLAVVFGEIGARQVKRGVRGGGSYGMALAGRICGWIGIVVGIGFTALLIVGEFIQV